LKEIDGRKKESRWMKDRRKYYERSGWCCEEVVRRMMTEEDVVEELTVRDIEVQQEEQRDRIDRSRYNDKYKKMMTNELPHYLKRSNKKEMYRLAKKRCEGSRYWESSNNQSI
jgi:hypothetical protein